MPEHTGEGECLEAARAGRFAPTVWPPCEPASADALNHDADRDALACGDPYDPDWPHVPLKFPTVTARPAVAVGLSVPPDETEASA
jgi:hypothetical protein